MKKIFVLAALLAVFIVGCSSKIDEKTVKKYEDHLNASIASEDIGIKIEPFICAADGINLVCNSSGGVIDDDLMSAKNITFITNEIYFGEPAKLSFSEYYTTLFKEHSTLKSKLIISDIALDSTGSLADEAAAISPELGELTSRILAQKINFELGISTTKNGEDISYTTTAKLSAANELNASFELSSELKEQIFTNYSIDTETLKINSGDNSLLDPSTILNLTHINSARFDSSLDTRGALNPYVEIAKSSLAVMKGDASANDAKLFDSAISIINSITKNPVFRLNISADFANQSLEDIVAFGASSIKKLIINGEDATELINFIDDFAI